MHRLENSQVSGAAGPSLAALLFAAALGLSGCPDDPQLQGGCTDDASCVSRHGEGWFCSEDYVPRTCLCTGDDACGRGEFCNASGRCQARVGCYTNDDCQDDDLFCDTEHNTCVDATKCTSDLHCPIGTLCDAIAFRCVPGCHVNGDCPLGQVCRCGPDDPECTMGQCQAGLCDDQTFCGLKELCELDDEVGDSVCIEDTRGPYCDQCQTGPGEVLGSCGPASDRNYCLVDTSVPGGYGSYCGVDCSRDQPCPNGFGCHYIVILTQSLCGSDDDCAPTGGVCETDEDCPGGRCAIDAGAETGRCAGKCRGHEGGASGTGFCTCVQDTDCPQDTCDPTARVCGWTRVGCQLDGDQCRGQLSCVNINGVGGCVIGKNCAPDEGVSCAEVREQ